MKRLLPWLHTVPTIVFLGLGFLAWTRYTAWRAGHRAEDQRFLAQTLTAFREINEENARLQRELLTAKRTIVAAKREAAGLQAREDSILAEHPVAQAPPACAPWATALLTCQLRASTLQAGLDSAEAALESAEEQAGRVGVVLDQGAKALDKARGCRFPCIDIVGGAGFMLDDELKLRKGVSLIVKLF